MNTQNEQFKFHAFAFTFRPKVGISSEDIEDITKICETYFDYSCFITEKSGFEKHAHLQLFHESGTTKSNALKKFSVKLRQKWTSEGSNWVRAAASKDGQKIVYNDDWYTNYLKKQDDTIVILDNMPPKVEDRLPFYAPPNSIPKKQCSPWYHSREKDYRNFYFEDKTPATPTKVYAVLAYHMNVKRDMQVIECRKQLKKKTFALVDFINQSDTITWYDGLKGHDQTRIEVEPRDPDWIKSLEI